MREDRERIIEDELARQTVRFITRPGFPYWDEISAAVRLFANNARVSHGERVLVCPCGHGALGVWAARRTKVNAVTLLDTNVIATQVARRTLALNDMGEATVRAALPSTLGTEFDVVFLSLPKGRRFARLLLLQAFNALRTGGRLYLAGPNRGGIKSVIGDAEELFGPAAILAYKGGNRVARLQKHKEPPSLPAIYREPGIAPQTYRTFQFKVKEEFLTAYTRPGVFSWTGLDAGTRLLLDTVKVRETDRVLDIGCGYGPIGIYAARQAKRRSATLMDVNVLACECARRSILGNGVDRAKVVLGDVVPTASSQAFSLILSNPPFHTGHAVTRDTARAFIRGAFRALAPEGRLAIVANRFLPYDHVIESVFGSVTILRRTSRYHVMEGHKGS